MIKNYICIPFEVLFDNELSDGAKKLYGLISNICTDNDGRCKDSNEDLSRVFNVVGHTITRWVKELEKQGHISCKNYIRSYLGNIYETRIITVNHQISGYGNDVQINTEMAQSEKTDDVQNYTSCENFDESADDVQNYTSCDESDMMYKNVHHYKPLKPLKHKTLKSNNKNISENPKKPKPRSVEREPFLESSKTVNAKTPPPKQKPEPKPKLFSGTVERSSKKKTWLERKIRIVEQHGFSEKLEELIVSFLEGLAEMDALLPDNSVNMQLQRLESLPGEGDRVAAVETTITNGWKSLAYAIDNIKSQGKPVNKRFDDGLSQYQATQAEHDAYKEEMQRLNREGKLKWV